MRPVNIGIPRTGTTYTSAIFQEAIEDRAHYTTNRSIAGGWKYEDPDFFRERFTFAFVRNPYDWLVSYYEFIKDKGGIIGHERAVNGFPNFIKDITSTPPEGTWPNQSRLFFQLFNGSEILPRYIGRFETLHEDLGHLSSILGIVYEPLSPMNGTDRKPWEEYYDEELKDLVYNVYKLDFIQFGYERD